jgi:hypothetical protein
MTRTQLLWLNEVSKINLFSYIIYYLSCDFFVQFEHVLGILQIGLHPLLVLLVRDAEAVGHLDALLVGRT